MPSGYLITTNLFTNMKILVTGANGQLGNEMRIVAKGRSEEFLFSDIIEAHGVETTILDITDDVAVRRFISDNNVGIIVNCAAYTNVDKAEEDKVTCAKINTLAPAILASAAKASEALLIHISTDYVFGGADGNTPYREDTEGAPTGIYGKTKLAGEKAIPKAGCNHVIIRTSWLYSEFGKNFLKTMLSLTSSKPKLNVVFDQAGTPTYALDLAKAICSIIDDFQNETEATYSKNGTYHFSNEGVCSWYDFAISIARISGNNTCEISPCHSNEFPSKVIRPSYSVLDKTKIKMTFGISIPHWTEALERCYKNILQDITPPSK